MNEGIDDVTLTDMINEVDLNQNGKLELDEFLQVRSKTKIIKFFFVFMCY